MNKWIGITNQQIERSETSSRRLSRSSTSREWYTIVFKWHVRSRYSCSIKLFREEELADACISNRQYEDEWKKLYKPQFANIYRIIAKKGLESETDHGFNFTSKFFTLERLCSKQSYRKPTQCQYPSSHRLNALLQHWALVKAYPGKMCRFGSGTSRWRHCRSKGTEELTSFLEIWHGSELTRCYNVAELIHYLAFPSALAGCSVTGHCSR